jgi:hypothetical protein
VDLPGRVMSSIDEYKHYHPLWKVVYPLVASLPISCSSKPILSEKIQGFLPLIENIEYIILLGRKP